MNGIYGSVEELIGGTPMLELRRLAAAHGSRASVFAKLECFNPAGSVKDRAAAAMIDDAEASGRLRRGGTIIEPTSGNTGIGLASIGAVRGYRVIIVMPDTMSVERRRMMSAYGAELVLSDGALGMSGAIARAEELASSIGGAVVIGQFVNPANARAHRETTGPEIWEAMAGQVDIFVAGVGTGGTITGVAQFLKSRDRAVRICAVEPASSPVLSGGAPGRHGIQGIGAGFVPQLLDRELVDEVLTVADDDAFAAAREMGRVEGLLVGISSGAALHAALSLAARPENDGRRIAVLLPDGGDRYLSTSLYGGG